LALLEKMPSGYYLFVQLVGKAALVQILQQGNVDELFGFGVFRFDVFLRPVFDLKPDAVERWIGLQMRDSLDCLHSGLQSPSPGFPSSATETLDQASNHGLF
jgi:hypothetical protein